MANISFLPKDLALPKVWALPSTLLSVLRIVYGLLLVEHSIGHFFLSFPHASFIREFPPGLLYFTGAVELVGGFLITIGLFTRTVAFVLSGYMAVAYFWYHFPMSFFPMVNQGEAAVMYCFFSLYLVAAGPGRWAVDRD